MLIFKIIGIKNYIKFVYIYFFIYFILTSNWDKYEKIKWGNEKVFDYDRDGSVALDRDHEDSALRRVQTLVVAQFLENRRDLVAFEVSEQKLFEAVFASWDRFEFVSS